MSGDVPEIYWYLFWVGLAIVVEAFGSYVATIIHRRNMKVLELLESYADRGLDPPPALAALLSEQRGRASMRWTRATSPRPTSRSSASRQERTV